jgi:HK97 family phage portal protein
MGIDPPQSINHIGGVETSAGVVMSPQKAMQLSAVYACVKKISETIAMLPVHAVYKDGKFGRVDNVGNELLNSSPNGEITSNEFKETLIAMAALFGCGYAEIIRDRNGQPYELKLRGSSTKLVEVDGVKIYKVGKDHYVFPRDMIVIPSILRKSPVEMNKDTLGLFKAAQDYASKFFNGGGVMNGILSSDMPLSTEQIDVLLETWSAQQGKQTRLLPNGLKYSRLGVEPDKAQNTDSREFGAREICQIFGVPPAMIGLAGSNYGDYENQAKAFINNCIAPIASKVEAEYNLKLLTRQERTNTE